MEYNEKINFENLQKTFEEYKAVNEDVSENKTYDPLIEEKLKKLNASLDQYQNIVANQISKKQKPQLEKADNNYEKSSSLDLFIREGINVESFEKKSLSSDVLTDGGYLAPTQTEATILSALKSVSPMRQICSVQQISSGTYSKPVSSGGIVSGWVDEKAQRSETDFSSISSRQFSTMEIYAMPAATQTLLDDSVVDVEQWLANEVQHEFATKEGKAFVTGDGVNSPKGFLSYATNANDVRGNEELGYLTTGADGSLGSTPLDVLLDLVYSTSQSYRANSRFVMNRNTLSTLRKVRDAEGNYVWQPSTQFGQPSSLLGYPVTELEDMPDIAQDSFAIAYGDFARGYLIVDRKGINLLRDPYTAKPYILFYVTKRVGGGVLDFNAIKLLKFSA